MLAATDDLKQAGVPSTEHLAVVFIDETIAQYAQQHSIDQIVMSTRGMGSVSNIGFCDDEGDSSGACAGHFGKVRCVV